MRKSSKLEPWEKDFLILAYPNYSTNFISKYIGRTREFIKRFVTKYGIKKMPKFFKGDRFGRLVVIEKIKNKEIKNDRTKYLLKCDCGKTHVAKDYLLTNGHVKSCGCLIIDSRRKGYGTVNGQYFGQIKASAIKRKIEFDINIEYLSNLLIQQNYKCALTGLEITLNPNRRQSSDTASVDRIDPKIGYIPSNVQWVHKDVNRMKNKFSEEYYKQICCLVCNYKK